MTRARDVADTQDNTGGAVAPFLAGKNKIINGDFFWNQRNLTSSTTNYIFGFDRWQWEYSGGTNTMSAQTFSPGNPIAGYEPKNFLRVVTSGHSGINDYCLIEQPIEDARTLAGQTVTVSFWAKAASGTPKVAVSGYQQFSSGQFNNITPVSITIGTTWARYSTTFTMPSAAGKTIDANSFTRLYLVVTGGSNTTSFAGNIGNQNNTFDFWGVQVEAGSVATPFTTATGTIQGELAACQRYYFRKSIILGAATKTVFGQGWAWGTGGADILVPLPVPMRTTPTSIEYSSINDFYVEGASVFASLSAITIDNNISNSWITNVSVTKAGAFTLGGTYVLLAQSTSNAYLGWSAEL